MTAPARQSPQTRQTRQRAAIIALLGQLDEFTSAQQLHERLRDSGTQVGLTTVYRSLQSLAQSGEVDQLITDDGEAVYRKCSAEHHHHLVCRSCGATVEVAGPAVEAWAEATATAHGYTEVSHMMEITGICAACGRP